MVNSVFVVCLIKNLSGKAISALLIELICYDVWGRKVGIEENVQFLDLFVVRDEDFGADKWVKLIHSTTRSVDVVLKKVLFENGEILDCTGEIEHVPENNEVESYFENEHVCEQYQYVTGSKYIPVQMDNFWKCACGALNCNNEEECHVCGIAKDKVFAMLDSKVLENEWYRIHEERELLKREEEARVRAEQEEKERKEIEQKEEEEKARKIILQAQSQQELLESIKRREETQIEADNRKKKLKTILISIVAILLLVVVIQDARKTEYRSQLRNMATEKMEEKFSNVYANIISINPYYFIYSYRTTSSGLKIGNGSLSKVVCRCGTVEGKTIWAVISNSSYPGAKYSQNEDDFKTLIYSSTSPAKLSGRIETASHVLSELGKKIGNDVFVLEVNQVKVSENTRG